jgi:hypothetical protein
MLKILKKNKILEIQEFEEVEEVQYNSKNEFESKNIDLIENKSSKYNLEDIFEYFFKHSYKILSNDKVNNIIIFYRITRKNILVSIVKKEAKYYYRLNENNGNFSFENFSYKFKNIDNIYYYDGFIHIRYNNLKKNNKFNIGHSYYTSILNEMTNEEIDYVKNKNLKLKINCQMLYLNIVQKINQKNNISI